MDKEQELSIRQRVRDAYLKPDGDANILRLEELLKNGGAHFYERPDRSRGIWWPTLEDDLLAFEEVLQIIYDALVGYDYESPDREYRSLQLPEIIEILEESSPLFSDLATIYSSRPESTADHTLTVARMTVTDGLLPEQVIIARVQALYHDIGKKFLVVSEQISDGRVIRRLSGDHAHHHATFSALMLDELLYRVEGELSEVLNLSDPLKRQEYTHPILLHHGLEAVASDREHLTPAEFAKLIAEVPASLAHTVILLFADMGAAGKPEYLSINTDAFFSTIEVYRQQYGENLIHNGSSNTLEEILINSFARIIYEMQQDEWLSLSSADDEMVIDKIVAIMNNVNLLLSNFEAIAETSDQQEKLLAILSRALTEVYKKIEKTIHSRAETIITTFHEIFDPIVDAYSLPILQSMQQV